MNKETIKTIFGEFISWCDLQKESLHNAGTFDPSLGPVLTAYLSASDELCGALQDRGIQKVSLPLGARVDPIKTREAFKVWAQNLARRTGSAVGEDILEFFEKNDKAMLPFLNK